MSKFLPGVVIAIILFFNVKNVSYAQTIYFPDFAASGSSVVTATVGQFYLNITGYQSPNASVVIETLSQIFLTSTTANTSGYFGFSNVLITDNFPGFCFTAIDFRRVGESQSCVEIENVITENQTYNDIFLPPTIGLSKKLIAAGEDAQIYGYSMPNAKVDIDFSGETVTLQADETGYYQFDFNDVPAGVYVFSSDAQLNGVDSLEPKTKVVLEALTLPDQVRRDLTGFAQDLEKKFPGALLIIPLLLILIALLIALIWKTKPRFLYFIFDKFKKKHPMHHDYFLFKQ